MPDKKKTRSARRKIEKESEDRQMEMCCRDRGRHHSFWGIVFIVLGFYWLAKSLGWMEHIDLPLFPLALIVLGVFFVIRSQTHEHSSRRKDEEE